MHLGPGHRIKEPHQDILQLAVPTIMQSFRMAAILFAAVVFSATPAWAQIAVQGDLVYTSAGAPIEDGVVLVRGSEIESVGAASDIEIPAGYRRLSAAVVTPGLIDAHSVVGLSGINNLDHDQDQLEESDPIQPELRAIDAYNPREPLVEFLRGLGITTVHTGHGPGALISGQTMIVKTAGESLEKVLVDTTTMLAMSVGRPVSWNFDTPGTRPKGIAMLREKLTDAAEYLRKIDDADAENDPPRDLEMDMLAALLRGDVRALVTAQRAPQIMATLRLAEEFDFPLVLDGASEAYLVSDEISDARVPVVIHPTMARPQGATPNAAFTTAAELHEAGIPVYFQSGYEGYVPKTRVVLYEAAIAVANGLDREAALDALTIDAARFLGIGGRVGSLEAGKDADLVLFDGDPFEYTTHTCTVIIEGEIVSDECR